MRRALLIFAVALLVAGCGGSSRTAPPGSGQVALATRHVSGLGTVLVNGQGRTLYVFASSQGQKLACNAACQKVFPPLRISSGQRPGLSGGVRSSLVSSVTDPSGGSVVAYHGWPLHLYVADPTAGTASGQALKSGRGIWFAISPSGQVIKKPAPTGTSGTPHGYCLSAKARIATPNGSVQADRVEAGMVVWSVDRADHRIAVRVLRVHRTAVPADHMMVRLRLADGRTVLVSLGHPLPDGQPVARLAAGQRFEGSRVASTARVRYGRPYTYDLLPAGPTHTYFADGVLLGSTLAPTTG